MNILQAVALLTDMIGGAQRLATAIKRAGEEGRQHLTIDELRSFQAFDDAARDALRDAIAKQRALDLGD